MSRAIHLKIKILTLVAEARLIRKEERKALAIGRHWKFFDDPVRAKDGTYRTDRSGQRMDAAYRTYNSLHDHRILTVRSAARTNHLAYGFLLGNSYVEMEKTTKSTPDFSAIHKIVQRFGSKEDLERWDEWHKEALAHLAGLKQKAVA